MPGPVIDRVFVLMLENRSFDHMLGCSGLTGTDIVTGQSRPVDGPTGMSLDYEGKNYPVGPPGINPMPVDPAHEFPDVLEQLCGQGVPYSAPYPPIDIAGAGYIADYVAQMNQFPGTSAQVNDPLACLDPSQVPVICDLAQNFLVCDAWFSSMPGPTVPNRFFVHAASSGGLDHSPTRAETLKWMAGGYSFQNGTIFNRIAGTYGTNSFRIYQGDSFALAHMLQNMNLWYSFNFHPYSSFASDVAHSNYSAKYTFIEPNYGEFTGNFTCGTSQHPTDDVTRGEWLIKCTYEAIRASPHWETSLFVVLWDEHGGFYDHVPPPPATPPGDKEEHSGVNCSGFTFAQCGPRVAAVVVSPFVPAGSLDGRPYEHSSVPATLEAIFGLQPLTARDAGAPNLLRVLTLGSPRDTPTTLAEPAPGVKLADCGLITGCSTMPTTTAHHAAYTAAAASPEPGKPLAGNQPSFLLAALQRDLASTPPIEHQQRIARFTAVGPTERDGANYLLEVSQRAEAAEAVARASAEAADVPGPGGP